MDEIDIILLKNQLSGANLKNLLKEKNITKYRLAKDCGVSWKTVYNWIKEFSKPNNKNIILIAKYLGLIPLSEIEKSELKEEIEELKARIKRLG